MPKFLKNWWGWILGYSSCPNCGDSWGWKSSGDLVYAEDEHGTESGVLICTECLSDPSSLDPDRIAANMSRAGFDPVTADAVKVVIAYRQGQAAT